MSSIYYLEYTDVSNFTTIQLYDDGFERVVPNDSHDLTSWISEGHTPEKKLNTTDRFLSIVNNEIIVDPNKDQILADEAAAQALLDAENQAIQEYNQIVDTLKAIDVNTVRSVREKLVTLSTATSNLTECVTIGDLVTWLSTNLIDSAGYITVHEEEAITERAKLS